MINIGLSQIFEWWIWAMGLPRILQWWIEGCPKYYRTASPLAVPHTLGHSVSIARWATQWISVGLSGWVHTVSISVPTKWGHTVSIRRWLTQWVSGNEACCKPGTFPVAPSIYFVRLWINIRQRIQTYMYLGFPHSVPVKTNLARYLIYSAVKISVLKKFHFLSAFCASFTMRSKK